MNGQALLGSLFSGKKLIGDSTIAIHVHCLPLCTYLLFEAISENIACSVCMSGSGVMIFLVLVSHTISTTIPLMAWFHFVNLKSNCSKKTKINCSEKNVKSN
jgi:hypothetical protein